MTPVEHNPNCAIVRSGDIRAWCDCGAEIPVLNEIRANVSETIGAGKERAAIVRWLRSGNIVVSMDGSAEDVIASAIEAGAHNETDD